MIVVYMQDTLKMLGEFPKPDRIGQTDRGAYIVYEFPVTIQYSIMGRKEREKKEARRKPKISNKLDVRKLSVQEEINAMAKRMLDIINKKK